MGRLEEQAKIMRRAAKGEFRLLYLSPERLARADTISWLEGIPVRYSRLIRRLAASREYGRLRKLRADIVN